MSDRSRLVARIDRYAPAGIAVMAALLSIAYFADAYGASSRIHNIILLTPLTGGVALLALVVVGRTLLERRAAEETPAETAPATGVSGVAVAAMMAALVLFVVAIPYAGFDVASIVFMAVCLLLQGERRWLVVLGWSCAYGLLITWLMTAGAGSLVPTTFI